MEHLNSSTKAMVFNSKFCFGFTHCRYWTDKEAAFSLYTAPKKILTDLVTRFDFLACCDCGGSQPTVPSALTSAFDAMEYEEDTPGVLVDVDGEEDIVVGSLFVV